jgi:mannitol-1-phosphate 5-dehydrogenase
MSDSSRKKLVQFGAGNIGRSFIGQLFSQNGWDVVFVDVNKSLVDALNEKGEYKVYIKTSGKEDRVMLVSNVRAVMGNNEEAILNEIKDANIICTSVGSGVLPKIMPVLGKSLLERSKNIDLILAENIRNGAYSVRKLLKPLLPEDYPLNQKIGLIETSIGKMVPIMKAEDLLKDPLAVFAEEYNDLIVDKKGFLGPIPDFEDLKPVDNITAYVDRKLFIHNLGHAATAYLGYQYKNDYSYVWEALEIDSLFKNVRGVMLESAEALLLEYPETFNRESLILHIDDLLSRFKNRALGDTIFRVGRDLLRKLSPDDRIAGAIKLTRKYGVSCEHIENVYRAACSFEATDENGYLDIRDRDFHRRFKGYSVGKLREEVSMLNDKLE